MESVLLNKLATPRNLLKFIQPKDALHRDIITKFEKIPTDIYTDSNQVAKVITYEVASLIKRKIAEGKPCVLGLTTGSTMVGIYQEMVRLHVEEGVSFRNVVTFNLDEYFPILPDSMQSYQNFMNKHLFDHIDIEPDNINFPNSSLNIQEVYDFCRDYEKKIEDYGGINLLLLGIGRTGHIGFNEPGSQINSRTRLITLDIVTRIDAAKDFTHLNEVPMRAITMGVQNIMNSERIILVALGEAKAEIIKQTLEEPVTERVPASYIQLHSNATVILDEPAAAELTRIKTPWLLDTCEWNDRLIRKAAVWICQKLKKPILKLTGKDYNENGMGDLVTKYGPAYNINIKVFNDLQHTITGWPGGKPNADDTYRPERAEPAVKRIIIFSPHPDDDVISMGGTLSRLVDQNHDLHVAYQTSGNIAVSDENAIRFISFINSYTEFYDPGNEKQKEQYEKNVTFLTNKKEGEIDSAGIRMIKTIIRRVEAKAACRYIGVRSKNLHFLELPFYETGTVKKKPIGEADIQVVMNLLQEIKPHQVYAAGDLSDPHGTHRVCLDAVLFALERLKNEAWMKDCYVWLYRGAWQEWDIDQIDMAVPLSPEELVKKRQSIYRHQSQKEGAMFPGSDSREFWQRAEDRNRATAQLYDKLGMAEYEAIEAFVRLIP
jgi:glucosamine-6-phosphate deaminase